MASWDKTVRRLERAERQGLDTAQTWSREGISRASCPSPSINVLLGLNDEPYIARATVGLIQKVNRTAVLIIQRLSPPERTFSFGRGRVWTTGPCTSRREQRRSVSR